MTLKSGYLYSFSYLITFWLNTPDHCYFNSRYEIIKIMKKFTFELVQLDIE